MAKQKTNKSRNKNLSKTKRNKILLSLAGILLITIIVFHKAGSYGILNWDDDRYLIDNTNIKSLSAENLNTIFSEFYFGNYHPLTTLTYAIEYSVFELNPHPYHVNNIIIHLLNTALLFVFIYLIIGRIDVSSIVALLFAVHPMHVESVAWISERKDVLYTFFYLGALISYFYYLKFPQRIKFLILTFFLFILSLLSKSAAVTLPLVLLLMDYYTDKKFTIRLIIEKIPFFLLSVFFGILAMLSQNIEDAIVVISNFNWLDRLFLVSYSIMFYIVKFFVPVNLSAIHFYPDNSGGSLPVIFYLAPLGILLIVWLIYRAKVFRKELIFGALFFIFTISVVLQLIPIGRAIVSERYTYVPYIGLFFIVGQFYNYVDSGKFSFSVKVKSYLSYVLVAYIILLSLISYNRVLLWEDGVKLFSDVISKYPERYYSYWSRGNTYKNQGDLKNALNDYTKVIQLKPDFYEAYTNRGYVKYLLQENKQAINDYEKAIDLYPENAEALNNLGLVYARLKQYEKAVQYYDRSIELDSSFYITYDNRGRSWYHLDKYDNALSDFNKVINLNPSYSDAFYIRGLIHLKLGDKVNACEDWRKAAQLGHKQAAGLLQQYCI